MYTLCTQCAVCTLYILFTHTLHTVQCKLWTQYTVYPLYTGYALCTVTIFYFDYCIVFTPNVLLKYSDYFTAVCSGRMYTVYSGSSTVQSHLPPVQYSPICPTVQCTQCTVYSVQYPLYTVPCTVQNALCIIYSAVEWRSTMTILLFDHCTFFLFF